MDRAWPPARGLWLPGRGGAQTSWGGQGLARTHVHAGAGGPGTLRRRGADCLATNIWAPLTVTLRSVPTQPGPPWAWEASAHLSPTALPSPALVAQPGGWHLPRRSWFSPESHQSLSAPEGRGTFWAFPNSKVLKRRSYLHDTPYLHQVPITGLLAGLSGRDGRWPLRTVGQAQA